MAASSAPGCVAHTTRPMVRTCTRTLARPADPSEPGFVLSPGGWTPPSGVLPAWNWLPSEGAAPHLDLVPWWARAWSTCRSSTVTRTHGCGGMVLGRSGRRIRSRGTQGHRLTASSGQQRRAPASERPGRWPGAMLRRRSEAGRLARLRQRFGVRVPGGAPHRPGSAPVIAEPSSFAGEAGHVGAHAAGEGDTEARPRVAVGCAPRHGASRSARMVLP
jgi:hypothetical protein